MYDAGSNPLRQAEHPVAGTRTNRARGGGDGLMSSAISTVSNSRETLVLTVSCANGNRLEYSEETDARIVEVIDGKVWCSDDDTACELESEMRAAGLSEARAFGCAVVFWS